jgi:thiol:disulfide interchange protein DsbD
MHDASRSVSLRFPRPAARVRRILSALAMLAPIVAGAPAAAQFAPPARPALKAEPTTGEEAVRVRWAVVGEAKPGGTVRVAASFTIHPKWHIYWSNPGESGAPTRLSIELPEGCRLVDARGGRPVVDFPLPEVIRHGDTTIGYEGEVTLSFAVRLPETLPEGGLPAKVTADWLVCRESCLLGKNAAEVDLAKPVAAADPAVERLAASLKAVPAPFPKSWKAALEMVGESEVTLVVTLPPETANAPVVFLPHDNAGVALAEGYVAEGVGPTLRVPLTISRDAASDAEIRVSGVIAVGNGKAAHAFELPVPMVKAR